LALNPMLGLNPMMTPTLGGLSPLLGGSMGIGSSLLGTSLLGAGSLGTDNLTAMTLGAGIGAGSLSAGSRSANSAGAASQVQNKNDELEQIKNANESIGDDVKVAASSPVDTGDEAQEKKEIEDEE
jgi:outer membrane murein-binding lipoprotein Lpp